MAKNSKNLEKPVNQLNDTEREHDLLIDYIAEYANFDKQAITIKSVASTPPVPGYVVEYQIGRITKKVRISLLSLLSFIHNKNRNHNHTNE